MSTCKLTSRLLAGLIILWGATALAAAPTADASREGGEISGIITNCAGTAEDYLIYVPGTSFNAISDPAGNFKMSYVQPGRYTLLISKNGSRKGSVSTVDVVKKQLTDLGSISICLDSDGDGYNQITDCDDSNPNINPGAAEVCGDGTDNNCDAVIDEGCTVCTDLDSDGFFAQAGCGSEALDCDDNNSIINPGAEEVCDGIDNDCDAEIDEFGAHGELTWYLDTDSDSFGDPTTSLSSCGPVTGYVTNGSDCDDSNASINPGAPEILNDGIDQNCNGLGDDSLIGFEMLSAHNNVRATAEPTPQPPLTPFEWDAAIAATAQAWAETCIVGHNPDRGFLGENAFFTSGDILRPSDAVNAWAAEAVNYDYVTNTCVDGTGFTCGHYLQIVWRETLLLGCGLASCNGGQHWICNYSPPGNIFNGPPPY